MNRPGITRERSIALFVLGVLLFNPPLLTIFGVDAHLFGVPLSFLYLFLAWAAVILLVAAIAERSGARGERPVGPARGAGTRSGLGPAANDGGGAGD